MRRHCIVFCLGHCIAATAAALQEVTRKKGKSKRQQSLIIAHVNSTAPLYSGERRRESELYVYEPSLALLYGNIIVGIFGNRVRIREGERPGLQSVVSAAAALIDLIII